MIAFTLLDMGYMNDGVFFEIGVVNYKSYTGCLFAIGFSTIIGWNFDILYIRGIIDYINTQKNIKKIEANKKFINNSIKNKY